MSIETGRIRQQKAAQAVPRRADFTPSTPNGNIHRGKRKPASLVVAPILPPKLWGWETMVLFAKTLGLLALGPLFTIYLFKTFGSLAAAFVDGQWDSWQAAVTTSALVVGLWAGLPKLFHALATSFRALRGVCAALEQACEWIERRFPH